MRKGINADMKNMMITGLATIIIILIVLLHNTAYLVQLCMLVAIFLLASPNKEIRFNSLDYIILCLILYIIFRSVGNISTAPIKTSELIAQYSIIGLSYISSRKLCLNANFLPQITANIYWITLILVSWSILSLAIRKYQLSEIGFSSSFDFRYMNTPWGYPNNCLGLICVEMSCIALLSKKNSLPLLFLFTLSIISTFSKGTYLAYTGFLICLFLTGQIRFRDKACIAIMTGLCAGGILFCQEIQSFISNLGSYTTTASYQWRANVPLLSYNKLTDIIWGNGLGSYSLINEKYDAETFTNSAPNIIIQSLTELGIIGIAICLLCVVFVLFVAAKSYRDRHSSLMIALVVFCIIKEGTQGFLFASYPAVFLFAIMLGGYNSIVHRSPKHTKDFPITNDRQYSGTLVAKIAAVACLISSSAYYAASYYFANITETQKIEATYNNNPRDLYSAILLAETGELPLDAKSIALLDNPFVYMMVGEQLYQNNLLDSALTTITKAVAMHPSLAHSDCLNNITMHDSIFSKKLKESLIKNEPSNATPNDMAKYGYILKFYNHPKADFWLRNAVTLAPYLSTPWLLLEDKKKFAYIKHKTPIGQSSPIDYKPFETISMRDEIINVYRDRFFSWYGYEL